eukprot:TRINITY_DN4111_c0_g1_i1.p1 TRINITY_DN4111_c0_g1~~TRINITY_DN4111_c0_g1_i1.p1  ORF type:complete len:305 (-),score=31.11 TRINITY_DN4111_c0_g1_i1:390-1304(-)
MVMANKRSSVPQGMLAMVPLQGSNLVDNSRFGRLDLYIKVRLEGEDGRSYEATSAVVTGAELEWNQRDSLHLPVHPSMAHQQVQVSVWGQDRFEDDLLALGSVSVLDLCHHRLQTEVAVSVEAVGAGDHGPGGCIRFQVCFYPTSVEWLYVFGGKSHDWESTGGLIERYDPVRDEWCGSLGSIPSQARDGAAAALLTTPAGVGFIYLTGGLSPRVSTTVERYDILRDTWTEVAPMLVGRHGHALVPHHNCLYAFGGATDHYGNGTTVCCEFWRSYLTAASKCLVLVCRMFFLLLLLFGSSTCDG